MEYVIVLFIFLLGISIGSFLNVVIYRVPLKKSIISPPSSCPKCGTKIKPWHNIPIFGWIILGGKCAECKNPISIRYPIVEFLTGVIAVLVYFRTGLNIYFAVNFAVFATLLALSMIDFDYKAVPDSLNLLALTLSFFTDSDILNNLINALIVMGGMSLIRYYVSYFLKKEAMGEGDVIVAGTMGALLGIKMAIFAIFLASLLAILPSIYNRIKNSDLELPFVPFLALATFLVWSFNDVAQHIWSYLYG